jgi:hypothetical protein
MLLDRTTVKKVDEGGGYFIGEIITQHPHLTYLRAGTIVTLFDGLDTALDFVTKKMPQPKRGKSSVTTGRDGFNAFDSYEMALETFRHKPEKVSDFDPAELRIKDVSDVGSQVEYDVVGDYIDMGRYMEGVPENMGTMHNGNARNRRANILINLNQMYNIEHGVIKHRGERILRLIDALEAGGIRTMLTGAESSECNHTEVILKRHDEPLTIADLAVATHPEFLRRVIFRIIEHSKTFEYGYGSAVEFGYKLTPEVIESGNVNEMDIVIDGNFRSNQTIDESFDQLERLLVWEMSKPIPEVSSIRVDATGLRFNPNGARSESEIRREGLEVIREV